MFSTVEDVQDIETVDAQEEVEVDESAPERPRAKFDAAKILPRLEKHFAQQLVKRSRSQWSSPDGSLLVSCQASKFYTKDGMNYWFGLKRTNQESLMGHQNSFCALELGSYDHVLLIPIPFWLDTWTAFGHPLTLMAGFHIGTSASRTPIPVSSC